MYQKVSVFQVGEQECHPVPGADGQGAGQHTAAVGLLYDGDLRKQEAGALHGKDCEAAQAEGARNSDPDSLGRPAMS